MNNNIIKDDREISMKAQATPTGIYNEPEAIATDCNLSTEICEINTETFADIPDPTEPMMVADDPIIEPAEAGQSIQAEMMASFENIKSTTTKFFNSNRQLFINLGWIVLALLGAKVVFATLSIIDDIPLVTPLLKLVGLVSVVRFVWRYLIREHDRQELIEMIDRTKVEILGDRNPNI
jgi:hypothetical protein